MTFTGKVIAITGAAGGIGQAVCRYFGGQGAVIATLDKNAALRRSYAIFPPRGPSLSLRRLTSLTRMRSQERSSRFRRGSVLSPFLSTMQASQTTLLSPGLILPDGEKMLPAISTAPITVPIRCYRA
jgi:NAD(P)-dependent dehydrogenase (short-subunit alcohol dehydrogenase family)